MAKYNLNIISLDIPFPPDYGGVIDIFYKIKALHELGVNIYLHCFEYGRTESLALNKYCKQVFYYKRKTGVCSNLSFVPYIIYSRRSNLLLNNLKSNNYPILFEGLHSIYPLLQSKFHNRQLVLRSHNIEHDYYKQLAVREKNLVKKIYFYKEAWLLKRTLNKLPSTVSIAAISKADTEFYKKKFKTTFWLPPFHSNQQCNTSTGFGNYALYHGNLSVVENLEAVESLIKQFKEKKINLVIAGKNPPKIIFKATKTIKNIELIANPSEEKMQDLIQKAHVVLLPTQQDTGIKLKLIESLYKGRFCVGNHTMVKHTMLEKLVEITENDFYTKTESLMEKVFSEDDIQKRNRVLARYYNNTNNAMMLLQRIKKDDS